MTETMRASIDERKARLRSAANSIGEAWARERVRVELPALLDLLAAAPHSDAGWEKLRCEKCGGTDIWTRYRAEGDKLDDDDWRSWEIEAECLRRGCRTCRYRWTDPLAAAPRSEKERERADDERTRKYHELKDDYRRAACRAARETNQLGTPKDLWDTAESAERALDAHVLGNVLAAAPREGEEARGSVHCENCGCDWLDNGLNPLGCPYCRNIDKNKALIKIRAAVGTSTEAWHIANEALGGQNG